MTEISIIGAKDEVDAEETLIKAAKDIQKDLEKETEFEEPYLKSIDDEEIYVEFGTNISPCLIKSTENKDYVYMILPIRLKED